MLRNELNCERGHIFYSLNSPNSQSHPGCVSYRERPIDPLLPFMISLSERFAFSSGYNLGSH